jgi:tetratricopeptide (TPR) repeat protein
VTPAPRAPAASPAPWLRELFETLLPLTPAERAARLAQPGLPPTLVAEVQALLANAPEATGRGFLSTPAAAVTDTPSRAGQRLGAWQLDRLLGTGGMGEVWLAQRIDGAFQGEAAVKLLKRGMDSDAVLARFAMEQQALARLVHPHIARLLDAGRSPDGLPYFVMEHVHGRQLDQAAALLPLRGRLALFLQLADAVAHAHRHLLVHRDLKPGNVLVDAQGEVPQVKLLDFGIAKALQAGGAEATATALAAYTPRYASPEQVGGEPISTATDIYSLGVILYELLTGQPPYALGDTSAAAAARAVLEEEPRRPSAVAGSRELRRQLAGDLDNIVLKALEKAPERRYASVDALAADLRAHLGGHPVSAHAPGRAYVLGKLVRRHRGASAGVLASVLLLAGGVAATLWQAQQARAARDVAQERLAQTRSIVRELVARHADAVTFLPGGVALKTQLLRDTVQRLQALLPDPLALPELAGELAQAHARLADLLVTQPVVTPQEREQALQHANDALRLFTTTAPVHTGDAHFHVLWSRTLKTLSHHAQFEGRVGEALTRLQQRRDLLLAASQQLPADVDVLAELGDAQLNLGQLYDNSILGSLRDPAQALAALDQAQATYLEASALNPTDAAYPHQVGMAHGGRMMIQFRTGQTEAALQSGREALVWVARARALAPEHVALRMGEVGESQNLARVLLEAGQTAQALDMVRFSETRMRALEADDAANPGWTRTRRLLGLHYGRVHLVAGLPAQALAYADEVVVAIPPQSRVALSLSRGAGHLLRAQALQALAHTGEAGAALQAARDDLQAYVEHNPADADAWFMLGQVLAHQDARSPGDGAAVQAAEAAEAAFQRAQAVHPYPTGLRPAQRAWLQAWRADGTATP